ncbi:MAG TPA: hypothetical protein VEH30_00380, partial [Terriglobales bacterium]|nr:hypothetical protein [Terriglobales bacterium]
GVLYLNSSGKVDRLETRYQTGTDRGIGVLLEGGSATPAVTIENSNMHRRVAVEPARKRRKS